MGPNSSLTFTEILIVETNPLTIIDKRSLGIQVCAWAIWKGFVVEMKELTVV